MISHYQHIVYAINVHSVFWRIKGYLGVSNSERGRLATDQ